MLLGKKENKIHRYNIIVFVILYSTISYFFNILKMYLLFNIRSAVTMKYTGILIY